MKPLVLALLLVLTPALAGCVGINDKENQPGVAALYALPPAAANQVIFGGCENRYGFFEAPADWVKAHIPEGFEPALPAGFIPVGVAVGFLGVALFSCSRANVTGAEASLGRGLMWFVGVEPPAQYRASDRASYFVALGWLLDRVDLSNATRAWGLSDSLAQRIELQDGLITSAVRAGEASAEASSVALMLDLSSNAAPTSSGTVHDRIFFVAHASGTRPRLVAAANFDFQGTSPFASGLESRLVIQRNATLFPAAEMTGGSGWVAGGAMSFTRVGLPEGLVERLAPRTGAGS